MKNSVPVRASEVYENSHKTGSNGNLTMTLWSMNAETSRQHSCMMRHLSSGTGRSRVSVQCSSHCDAPAPTTGHALPTIAPVFLKVAGRIPVSSLIPESSSSKTSDSPPARPRERHQHPSLEHHRRHWTTGLEGSPGYAGSID